MSVVAIVLSTVCLMTLAGLINEGMTGEGGE